MPISARFAIILTWLVAKSLATEKEKMTMQSLMFSIGEEISGLDQTHTETSRNPRERLAGSYVNFMIANGTVITPKIGIENDAAGFETLARSFPERDVIMLPGYETLLGGGGIHRITR